MCWEGFVNTREGIGEGTLPWATFFVFEFFETTYRRNLEI